MSIRHRVHGLDFVVETYWLKDCGPQAFFLIYSIDGVKVTKEQFVDALGNPMAATHYAHHPNDSALYGRATGHQ